MALVLADMAIAPDAVALALPDDMAFEAWRDLGFDLFANLRRDEWLVADWAKFGRRNFQPQLPFMAEQVGLDTKRLTEIAYVGDAFPEAQRAGNLSFAVHERLARVDEEHRLAMLKQASAEKWTPSDASEHVEQHKLQQGTLLPEDDPENREAVEIIRAWNRASKGAREYAYALMPKGFGAINEGEVQ